MIKILTILGLVYLLCSNTEEISGMVIVQQQKQSVSTGTGKNAGEMVFPWHSMSNPFNVPVSVPPGQSTNVVNAIAQPPPAAARSGVLSPQSGDNVDISSSQQQVVAPQALPLGPTLASLDARSAVKPQQSVDQIPGPVLDPNSLPSPQIPATGQSLLPENVGSDGTPRSPDPNMMQPPQTVPAAQTLNPADANSVSKQTSEPTGAFFPQIISIPDVNVNSVLPQSANGLPVPRSIPSGPQPSPQNQDARIPVTGVSQFLPVNNQQQGLGDNILPMPTDASLLSNLPVAPVVNGLPQTGITVGTAPDTLPNMVANEWNLLTNPSTSPSNV